MLANKDMVNEPSKVVEALPPEKGQLVAVDEELQDPEVVFLCFILSLLRIIHSPLINPMNVI
jgi:hypothetical protein